MEVINKYCYWMLMILLLEGSTYEGCLEHERIALLQIKASFNISNDYWSSWRFDPDCCNWDSYRTECSRITGQITLLDLSFMRGQDLGDWYLNASFFLNASLFLPFQQLKYLYLGGNNIVGCIKDEGFERLSTLANLEELDLSANKFSNNILSSLSGLSSLKSLYLSFNRLKGTIDIQELNNLSLKELSMAYNEIEGFKSLHGDEELLKLSNLEYLYLSFNHLNNNNLSFLKGLSSLKHLNIGFNQLKGSFDLKELNNLEVLGLSGNEITKLVGSRGLSNLSVLHLNNITIDGRSELLESLGALPYLKTLYLRFSNFKGTIFGKGYYNLTNVEELYLDYSSLDNNTLPSLGAAFSSLKLLSLTSLIGFLPTPGYLPHFKNLEHLYLNHSAVNNSFLQTIETMTSLKTLSLSHCGLSGTINQGWCKLKHLQQLDISHNDFNGSLPWCFANLTFLQRLDLSSNHFIGNISSSPLQILTSLEYLSLSNNVFQIPVSLSPLFNHSKLKYLDLYGSKIYAETEDLNWTPKFQLETLRLSGHGYRGRAFPKFLYNQHNLQYVDLSHFQMMELFPYWLLENNTKLESLCLANNSLLGPLQLPIHSHFMNLSILDISNNHLYDYIPVEIGSYFPRLTFLNMSKNGFSGSIPSSFGNMSLLQSLDMSNNELSGSIPEHLTIGCVLLNDLRLSNNSLQGQIFPKNAKLRNLLWLQLDGNKFTGSIPDSLSDSYYLGVLDVSHNNISGKIPEWIGNSWLQLLDLSENSISGSLPSKFSPPVIIEVYLSKNKLQGSLINAFSDCSELTVLDLSHNNFDGSIPKWIGNFSYLSYLLLSHNKFEGQIPMQLCNLDQLSLIDLSHNNLSGQIPPCLISASSWYRQQKGLYNASAPAPAYLQRPLEFTAKSISYSYKESILIYMSGVDLSCNKFTGQIPMEIGNLREIHVLNLSHNCLTGIIPSTFSNLQQIESLDLSHNNLQGKIPPQLTQLYSLAVFNVSYNNLSGMTPGKVAQFATFDESSYRGNRFLCGWPLPECRSSEMVLPPSISTNDNEEGNSFMDMSVFYVSFWVAYVMVLLVIAIVLYINPYWRRLWFYFIEVSMENCYYFIIDNFALLSRFK